MREAHAPLMIGTWPVTCSAPRDAARDLRPSAAPPPAGGDLRGGGGRVGLERAAVEPLLIVADAKLRELLLAEPNPSI